MFAKAVAKHFQHCDMQSTIGFLIGPVHGAASRPVVSPAGPEPRRLGAVKNLGCRRGHPKLPHAPRL